MSEPDGDACRGRPLPPGEVHVWEINLDTFPGDPSVTLTAIERDRAVRFRFPVDRTRWTIARAKLRTVLALYTERAPHDLAIAIGPHGKPALADPADAWLQFNLSHAGDRGLIAVSRDRPLGVDLERWPHGASPSGGDDIADLAAACFAPEEQAVVARAPSSREKARRFLRYWTAKEAILKAEGIGLMGAHPNTIRIPEEFALASMNTASTVGAFQLHPISPPDAGREPVIWAAALAVAGADPVRVTCVPETDRAIA